MSAVWEIEASPLLDAEPVAARIGLILLATDHTTERDFQRMAPLDRIGLYGTRVAYANPTTPENLRRLAPRLGAAAALILPGERLDALYFGCTSASVVIGDETVAAAVAAERPGVPLVTPVTAACDAFRALDVTRLSVLTPYTVETSRPLLPYFEARGLRVANLACFGFDDDREMARIRPDALVEAAVEFTAREAEALFISCTALRSAEVAAEIEAAIGRPVVTSNQAGVWRCLRRAGIRDSLSGYGRLLALPADN